jgi:hypothetical protein
MPISSRSVRREFDLFEGEIMKRLLAVMVTGCLLTLLVAAGVHAQDPGAAIRVSIPFDFTVEKKSLPAGEYEIRRINDEPTALLIQNVNNRRDEAIFQTEPREVRRIPNHSLLIFHRYGDSAFLSEVFTAGEETGEELRPTRAERTLRSEMAKNNLEPETVTVAMN